jgi:hypothetical protein
MNNSLDSLKKTLETFAIISEKDLIPAIKQCKSCAITVLKQAREEVVELNHKTYSKCEDIIGILENEPDSQKAVEKIRKYLYP